MRPAVCNLQLCAAACLLLASPGAFADSIGPPAPGLLKPPALMKCDKPGSDTNAWIDKLQRGVYGGVCGTALWFDGLFGNPLYDLESDETFGRLSLVETYDRRDQQRTQLLLRARYALPNVKHRLRLTVARGNEQQLVEERPGKLVRPLPLGFQDVSDDAWLLGLGYAKEGSPDDGFDFGIGVRLSTPVDPYVKSTYHHNFIMSDKAMLRFRETPFWRDSRGFGETTRVALDYLVSDSVMLRWNNTGTVAEDTEGLDWGTGITAYHSLNQRRAISYTALLHGETGADVPIQNFGVESRYRQSVFRKWLFLELHASVTWPRETLDEQREINPGVGLGLEMFFGPTADVNLR